jgi:hypothetical protein
VNARRAVLTVAAAALAIGAARCAGGGGGEGGGYCTPDAAAACPPRFDLSAWCHQTKACTVTAPKTRSFCGSTSCDLAPGEHAVIPIAQFAPRITATHELFVDYSDTDPTVDPIRVHARLDGVLGTAKRVANRDVGAARAVDVSWEPFPPAPETLELDYEDGDLPHVALELSFEDGRCEDANPVSTCFL